MEGNLNIFQRLQQTAAQLQLAWLLASLLQHELDLLLQFEYLISTQLFNIYTPIYISTVSSPVTVDTNQARSYKLISPYGGPVCGVCVPRARHYVCRYTMWVTLVTALLVLELQTNLRED